MNEDPPFIEETDLVDHTNGWNLVVGSFETLKDELRECYNEAPLVDVFCLKFNSVHNFQEIIENGDYTYTFDAILLRAIPARHP